MYGNLKTHPRLQIHGQRKYVPFTPASGKGNGSTRQETVDAATVFKIPCTKIRANNGRLSGTRSKYNSPGKKKDKKKKGFRAD